MALFTIKQGNHYHRSPPFSALPWVGEKAMARYVTFSPECRYDSAPYNSQDVNKLFGLSFGFGGVHDNSARFGWRWSNSDQCIELLAYVYKDGVRNWDEQMRFPVVAQVQPGQRVYCKIQHTGGGYYFRCLNTELTIYGEIIVPAPIDPAGFGLTHGFYFGGQLVSPHDMTVQIDRT